MSDAITVSAPISGTDRTLTFETGKLAQLADGAVVGQDRRHRPAGHGHRVPIGPGGGRLLPPDRGHRGAGLRRRQDPRLVLPPGGQVLGPGHPDLPADRPAAAPVLPQGLPQRGPRGRDHLRRRPGQPPRRPGHQRRLGRPDDLGHPLRGPHRGGPGGLLHRRPVDPAPHLPGGRRVHLRAGGGRAGPVRRRQRRDRHHDGRGRRVRALVPVLRRGRPPGHRGGPGRRPRGRQDVDPRVDRAPAPDGGGLRGRPRPGRDHRVLDLLRLRGRRLRAGPGRRHRRHRRGQQDRGQGRAQRRPRRRHHRSSSRPWPPSSPSGTASSRRPCGA